MSEVIPALEARLTPGHLKVDAPPAGSLLLDGEGRWVTARLGPWFLRRLVDGAVHEAHTDGRRQDLPAGSARHEDVRALAARLAEAWERAGPAARLEPGDADPAEVADRLQAASAWTPARFAEQERLFAAAYPEPPPMLPPDRYRDVVVLPATGCPHGRCAFCRWYEPASFRVLTASAFQAHLDAVAALLGAALANRTGVFLGSASALSVPDRLLLPHLDAVARFFRALPRGVAAFLDADHAPERDAPAWRRLAEAGLTRAVLGLETGHPPLRQALGKARDPARLAAAVHALRGAGIAVAITVLAGAGDETTDDAHLADTAALIARLDLDRRDLVYVSPLSSTPERPGLAQMTAALTETLRGATAARVAPYRVDAYRYFAF